MIAPADLRAWVGLDPADDTKDDLLTALEAGVVAFIEQHTGHYFGPVAAHSEIVRGDGGTKLRLDDPPVIDPEADPAQAAPVVVVAERPYPGADPTAFTQDDDFEVRTLSTGAAGVAWLHRLAGWVWLHGYEYTVEYSRGYAAGEEPAEIRQLVVDLVRLRYAELSRAPGASSETMGNYSYSRGAFAQAGILDQIPGAKDVLALWTRTFA